MKNAKKTKSRNINLKSCCIICSHSFPPTVVMEEAWKSSQDDKNAAAATTANTFTAFCEEIASKTTSGIMDVAGITMAPRILHMSTNDASPHWAVCANCLDNIGQAVEQKRIAQEVELQVMSLQIELLAALKQLENQMNLYSNQMGKVENSVRSTNVTRLNTHIQKLEKEQGRDGVGAIVWQLREGILNVSGELRNYQDDLSEKVCCDRGDDLRADPLDYALVKIEVEAEEAVDEQFLQPQDFLTAEDLEEIAPTQDKGTQTSGTFTSDGQASFSKSKIRRPRAVFKSRKYARATHAVQGKGHLKELINKFACQQCEERFSSKPSLESHHVKKHGAPKLKCKMCGKKFLNIVCLNVHLDKMHNNMDDGELELLREVFECHLCPKVCGTSKQLTAHLSSKHDDEQSNAGKRRRHASDSDSESE